MSVWQRVDKLGSAAAHVPEAHVFHMSGCHDGLGPGQVNVVNTGGALRGGVLRR